MIKERDSVSNEINEAMGKALQIMYEAEEAINSVTPAERRKCNAIIKKYIGESASKYGFQSSRFERAKDMVHEWIFERTVDAVSQSIVIREQPLARGELRLLCCGCSDSIETTAVYDKTVEGLEKAVIELKQFLENEAYDRFEQTIQEENRVRSSDYEDLYKNYLLYAESFLKNNELTEDCSLREKYDAIENVIKKCNKRGQSFIENREDLLEAAGYLVKMLLDIKDTKFELAEDKSNCYIIRDLGNEV